MRKFLFLFIFLAAGAAYSQSAVYEKDGLKIRSLTWNDFEPMLHQSNDTTYVVNFWATWCAPCIVELPHFEKLQKDYANKKVKVVLVSLDMRKQIESSLLPFVRRKKLQSEVVHLYEPNAGLWIDKVDPSWSGAIPATLIYNSRLRKFYEQSFTFEELNSAIQPFIK